MKLQVANTSWTQAHGDWLIVGLPESFDLSGPVGALDDALGGQIGRLRESQDFTGKAAETLTLQGLAGIRAKRLLLVGLGPVDKLSGAGLHKALMAAARAVSVKKTERITVAASPVIFEKAGPAGVAPARYLQIAATAMTVGCVGQDLYRA
ncbi:MAG TPA: M17 family peptidase N-terminal domain-containing protein, partial [Planctomycetaceae bacterium]